MAVVSGRDWVKRNHPEYYGVRTRRAFAAVPVRPVAGIVDLNLKPERRTDRQKPEWRSLEVAGSGSHPRRIILATNRQTAAIVKIPMFQGTRALRVFVAASTLLMLFGAVPSAIAFLQAPDQASPEGGSAQVVAQGVVDVPAGDLVWQIARASAPPPVNARPQQSRLGFLIVESGVLLTQDEATGYRSDCQPVRRC